MRLTDFAYLSKDLMKTALHNILYKLLPLYNRLLCTFMDLSTRKKTHPSIDEATLLRYNLEREKGARPLLCYAPFRHMYFGFLGEARACCINKTDRFGAVSEMPLRELWKSPQIEPLRDHLRNHNLSGACSFCELQLKSGNFKAFEGRLYDTMLPERNRDLPSEMTFELSNTCNLECIMCNGTYSSSIRKNRDKLPPLPDAYGEGFTDYIREGLPHLKTARFIGGEPFLIPAYYDILEYLAEHNPRCKVYIQTNGSVLNQRVKQIIEHTNIHLSISIDSLQKERYEYIRKNASFERLLEHLEYFRERSLQYQQVININFCVMPENWDEVPAMLDYCRQSRFTLTLIPVDLPYQHSLASLETGVLKNICSVYEASLPGMEASHTAAKMNIQKFRDLIQHISYLIGLQEETATAIGALKAQHSAAELKMRIGELLGNATFSEDDRKAAMALVEQYSAQFDDAGQQEFLASCLLRLEQQFSDMLRDYEAGEKWVKNFETYFMQGQLLPS